MEDLIRRSDAVAILEDLQKDHLQFCLIPFRQAIERVQALPSADRPQGDTVSRRYLLAEIDDLADEFSEVDENGLHSERWCGIVDAKLIIMNAPSVSDRPQGEWKNYKDEHYCTNCGEVVIGDWYNEDDWYDFCPHCGAKMKGADDDL